MSVEVVHDAPGTPSSARTYFADQLAARGWTARETPFRGPPGGFQSFTAPESTLFCRSEDGAMLNLTASASEGAPNDVRLSAQMLRGPAMGYFYPPAGYAGGPCADPQPQPLMAPIRPPGPNALPLLSPPTGVQLMQTGGSYGPNVAGSEALALTATGAVELESHFARQLEDAGWEQTGAGAEGALAWSLWDVPGEDGGQGLLLVLESPAGDHVALSLRLYLSRPPFGPSGFPPSITTIVP